MAYDDAKTPSQLAEEARLTGRDAAEAASGLADEAKAIAGSAAQSLRASAQDVKATAGEAADTAKGLARDARDIASEAADTGRHYAQDAVNAAGRKIRNLGYQASHVQASCNRYVAKEPVKSILFAAAGGAILTALLVSFMRGDDRRQR